MNSHHAVVPCSCEDVSHGNLGVVGDTERLARLLTDKHFNKSNTLKPSAFPISHIREAGLSLVRVDKVDSHELEAIAEDIRRLSGAVVNKGALLGSAAAIKKLYYQDTRAMCVKDDPVLNDAKARDNPAHAISVATRRISEEDAKEIREQLLDIFSPVERLMQIFCEVEE